MREVKRRAVIMCGADISDYSFYEALEGDYVICADRGYLHALNLGIIPSVCIGDFDSLELDLPDTLPKLQYPSEKDETDFQLALNHALSKGYKDLYAIGVFGGRMDHFLGNLSLMKWTRDRGGHLTLVDADTRIQFITSENSPVFIPRKEGTYLSILPMYEDAVISMSGVKYAVCEKVFSVGDTLGISNEITEEKAHFFVHKGSAFLLECKK